MKIISPLPRKRGRIEIIPLIDIMFFLLAAFMLVTINAIKIDSLHITLPTDVPTAQHETKEDFVSISVDTHGAVQVDKERITTKEQFLSKLQDLYNRNHEQKIMISADRDTHDGDVMNILGKVRQAGFQKVAFAIKNEHTPGAGANSDAPAAPGNGTFVPNSPPPPSGVDPAEAPAAPGAAASTAVTPATAPAAPSAPASAPASPGPAPTAPTPPAGH